MRASVLCLSMVAVLAACASRPPQPIAIDTRNDICSWCRKPVSDSHMAAELVAPHKQPLVFHDIACLRDYLTALKANPVAAPGRVAFVADHRTGAWVRADIAVYTRLPGSDAVMAHADADSRSVDRAAAGGEPVTALQVFGPGVLPAS
jgi:copper chaperone NosL